MNGGPDIRTTEKVVYDGEYIVRVAETDHGYQAAVIAEKSNNPLLAGMQSLNGESNPGLMEFDHAPLVNADYKHAAVGAAVDEYLHFDPDDEVDDEDVEKEDSVEVEIETEFDPIDRTGGGDE